MYVCRLIRKRRDVSEMSFIAVSFLLPVKWASIHTMHFLLIITEQNLKKIANSPKMFCWVRQRKCTSIAPKDFLYFLYFINLLYTKFFDFGNVDCFWKILYFFVNILFLFLCILGANFFQFPKKCFLFQYPTVKMLRNFYTWSWFDLLYKVVIFEI